MDKGVKPFRLDDEDYAEICHQGATDGPQIIVVNMDDFNPSDARRFARWLIKAADEVDAFNKKWKKIRSRADE